MITQQQARIARTLSPQKKQELLEQLAKLSVTPANIPVIHDQPTNKIPLSSNQERLWFLQQYDPSAINYNLYHIYQVDEQVNLSLLQQALDLLLQRHAILRSRFASENGQPYQYTVPYQPGQPFSHYRLEKGSDAELQTAIAEVTNLRFDLEQGMLFVVRQIKLPTQGSYLVFCAHHIIIDGISMRLLFEELQQNYQRLLNNQPPLSLPPVDYYDYVNWQRDWFTQDLLNQELQLWRQRLADIPALSTFPAEYDRPPEAHFQGDMLRFTLNTSLGQGIKQLARQQETTPFTVLLTVFKLLLMRYTEQHQLIVGTPVSGRIRPELQESIGYYATTSLLYTDFSGIVSFADALQRVKESAKLALTQSNIPFEKLLSWLNVPRSLSYTPLFQILFIYHSDVAESSFDFAGGRWTALNYHNKTTKYDLTVEIFQTADNFDIKLEYNTDLYGSGYMSGLAESYQHLCQAMVSDLNQAVSQVPLLSTQTSSQLWSEVNATACVWPQPQSLLALIARQCHLQGDKIAVQDSVSEWTYHQLWARVNQLADFLAQHGAKEGDRIGILLPRRVDLVTSMLAIWQLGAVYVPFDINQPTERLNKLIRRAELCVLISSEAPKGHHVPCVSLPQPDHRAGLVSNDNIRQPAADTLAYLLFTSGSTGEPKGVKVSHGGLLNLLLDMQNLPGCQASDRLLSVTTPTFDISFLEYLLPLLAGASLYITDEQTVLDSFSMAARIADYQPTIMQATPSFWHMLLSTGWQPDSQLRILAGGEPLPAKLANALLANGAELWNVYGPTETTIWSLRCKVQRHQPITIGKPIANTQIYVLDKQGNPLPPGITGELYIAGAGVGLGYDHQPELSAERFLDDPNRPGGKMFRTGDLVKFNSELALQFVGREDTQIKLRGYRIELGEIERVLAAHPQIKGAVIGCRELSPSSKALVAFFIANTPKVNIESLGNYLQQQLPAYMIPAFWQKVSEFPVTANGKIDRRRLVTDFVPQQRNEPGDDQAATPQELALIAIWQEMLQIKTIGRHMDFFSLGGHSILAVELLTKINATFNCHLALRDIFYHSTIAQLSLRISQDEGQPMPHHAMKLHIDNDVVNRHQPFPLTDIQRAYWLGRKASQNQVSTHVYYELDVGQLDIQRFSQALAQLIERHEMLRAVVYHQEGNQQILAQVPDYPLLYCDLRAMSPTEQQQTLTQIRDQLSHKVHPTDQWPLFDIHYSQLSATEGRLHFSLDLLIADAVSMLNMQQELIALYQTPGSELPRLPFSFRDYVLAEQTMQKSAKFQADSDYWQARLAKIYGPPGLPKQGDLATFNQITFTRRHDHLCQAEWQVLTRLAKQHKLTKTGLLLTVFSQILARWSAAPRFTLNITVFNRPAGYANVASIIGDFTAVSLLDVAYDSRRCYQANAEEIQLQLWDTLEHRHFSGVRVNEALMRGGYFSEPMPVVFTSLLDVDYHVAGTQAAEDLAEAQMFRFRDEGNITQTPQVWFDHQVMEQNGELYFNWDIVEQLFDATLIDTMFTTYCQVLHDLAQHPERWLNPQYGALTLPSVAALVDQSPAPNTLLHSGLLRQAALMPEAIALITPSLQLSYRQLDHAASYLAGELQQRGVQAGDRVAVMMEKGWQQIAAVHGILRAGGVYLPIDIALPPQRQQRLLNASEVKLILSQPSGQVQCAGFNLPVLVVNDAICDAPLSPLSLPATAVTDLAYIIFTSGSTGEPKGVMIDHRAAMNTVEDINDRFGLTAQDRLFGLSSLSFDLSVYDAFAPFMVGASLVLPQAGHEKDPRHWSELITNNGVTVWNSVPALLQMLSEYHAGHSSACPGLRLALLSGDWIPLNLPQDVHQRLNPAMTLISLGGATECAIWSVFYPIVTVKTEWTSIPYGRGLRNQPMYVLNEQFEECPVGVEGEIYIGGMGLAQGYLNDVEKTSASFISRPQTGERLYRTGDLGRYFADGQLAFLGRKDSQVKINGFRVELGEIKSQLEHIASVRNAEIVLHNDQLVAFVTLSHEASSQHVSQSLLSRLKTLLPYYMVPKHLYVVDAFPVTGNGKIDRAALLNEGIRRMSQLTEKRRLAANPLSDLEQRVAAIWRKVLAIDYVDINDNFFEVGGGSIEVVLIHRQLEDEFNLTIPIAELFRLPSVKKIAGYLQTSLDDSEDTNKIKTHRDSQLRAKQRLQRRGLRQH